MRSESTYLAARMVAETVEAHFVQHIAAARGSNEDDLAPEPPAHVIETILDAAFWASLRREEGHSPKISLALLPPEKAEQPLLFGQRFPLTPAILIKLSPGVERPGVHLGVWYEENTLYVWGTIIKIPSLCFVLDVSEPGLLVIKHRRIHGFGKFANVAVLVGDQVKIVDESSSNLPDCPTLLKSLLSGVSSPVSWDDSVNVLIQLAVSMRAHRHGGTLLVVPPGSDAWRSSIIHPLKYAVVPPYTGLADLLHRENSERNSLWQGALRAEIDTMAGLTAVDGATLITERFELHTFGAKIGRIDGNSRVEQVVVSEPVIGGDAVVMNPAQSGGTRHLSAAQFVHDQRDALALVASQDGHFTIFSWSSLQERVQAHRIDALLL